MVDYASRLERENEFKKKVKKHLDTSNLARYDIKVVARGMRKRIFTKY